ncbi:PQQ-binding-like beta-propeller repeat protein [Natronoarchaeum mannanilyticum]|uniref:outer membrane protein assembly factor BamB family protein n=1 Tax=Natronoarchaeum mannanilyticum TaxID=926360 RepID=UPI00361BC71A
MSARNIRSTVRRIAPVCAVLLLLAAVVALGTGVGATAVSAQSSGGLDQSASVSPNESQTFAPGGTYPVVVSVDVGEESFLSDDRIENPALDVAVEGDATIESVQPTDYQTAEFNETSATVSSDSFFRAGTTQTSVVLVDVPGGVDTGSVSLTATPRAGATEYETARAEYAVTSDVTTREAMANASAARNTLVSSYRDSYGTLLYSEPWNETTATAMRDGFATAITEGTKGAIVGSTPGLSTVDDIRTSYEVATGNYDGGTAGQIAKINLALKNDLDSRMARDSVRRAGNSSAPLAELERLNAQERRAWEEGDRDALEEALLRQRAVLVDASFESSGNPYANDYETSLLVEAEEQRDASRSSVGFGEENPLLAEYFAALSTYATDEYDAAGDRLALVREPSPQVTTASDRSAIEDDLRGLAENETTTVTFTVANADGAGVASQRSFLSLSHGENISIEDVSEIGTDEPPAVDRLDPGDEAIDASGEQTTLDHALVDVRDQYDPGQQRQYQVTISRDDEGEAWLSYRAAFRPFFVADGLSPEENQEAYERFPRSGPEDQQGWPAYTLSTDDTTAPPRPVIDAPADPTTGESVELDASGTTADAAIESYEWSLDTDDDGDADRTLSGETPTTTVEFAGPTRIRLDVTDADGRTATSETVVRVEDAALTANTTSIPVAADRSLPEPGDDLSFDAPADIEDPEWTLVENGTERDAGQSDTFSTTVDEAGTYELTLSGTVDGVDVETTETIYVASRGERVGTPSVRISAPSRADPGETIAIDASASTHPHPNRVIDGFELRVDGEQVDSNADGRFERAFDAEGDRTIEVVAIGSAGNESTASRTVAVGDASTDDPTDDPTDASDWTDPGRTGYAAANGTTAQDVVWERTFERSALGAAVGNGTTAVVTSAGTATDERLYSFGPNGSERWNRSIAGASGEPALGTDGTTYVRYSAGVRAFDADGSVRWDTENDDACTYDFCFIDPSRPVATEDAVYVLGEVERETALIALDPETGDQRWNRTFPNATDVPNDAIAAADGGAYAAVPGVGLVAVDADGTERWRASLPDAQAHPVATPSGAVLYTTNESLIALDADTGGELWTHATQSRAAPSVTNDGRIVVPRGTYSDRLEATYGIDVLDAEGRVQAEWTSEIFAGDTENFDVFEQPLVTRDGLVRFVAGPTDDPDARYVIGLDGTERSVADVEVGSPTLDLVADGRPLLVGTDRMQALGDVEEESDPIDDSVDVGVPTPPDGTWPRSRFDVGNTRAATDVTAPRSIGAAWEFSVPRNDSGTMPVSSTVATEDTVLVGLGRVIGGADVYNDSTVYAVDRQTGERRWDAVVRGSEKRRVTDMQVSGDTVLVEYVEQADALNRHLAAIDVSTGEERWNTRVYGSGPVFSERGDDIYLQSSLQLEELNATTGETEWAVAPADGDASFEGNGPPVVTNETVFSAADCEVPGSDWPTGCVVAVNRSDGSVRWVERTSHVFSDVDSSPVPVVDDGSLYVPGRLGGQYEIVEFDAKTGDVIANETLAGHGSYNHATLPRPAVTDSRFVTERGIYTRENFQRSASLDLDAMPAVVGDRAFGVADGELVAHELSTGDRIESVAHSDGAPDRIGAIADGTVVTVTDGNPEEFGDTEGAVLAYQGTTEPGFEYGPTEPGVNETVTFEASVAADAYGWDGDGDGEIEAQGKTVDLSFAESGTHDVTLVTDPGSDGSARYTRSVMVTEPIKASLDVNERHPKPSTMLELSAADSAGTGNLTYDWEVKGVDDDVSDCEATCEVWLPADQSVTVSVAIADENGQTDTTSVTVTPVDARIDVAVDGTDRQRLFYEDDVLLEETLTVNVIGDASLSDLRIEGVAATTDGGTVELDETGQATITAELDAAGVDDPVTREVELSVHEYRSETERFEFTTESRKTTVGLAMIQPQLDPMARHLEQRVGELPSTVHFEATDRIENGTHAGLAKYPDTILVDTTQSSTGGGLELGTAEHELTHIAQFEMDMETDGDWNFLLEGQASFEANTFQFYSVDANRPDRAELLDWDGSLDEYEQGNDFVSAFYAEYGRQTFLEMVEDSEGEDLDRRFEAATGESFDAFYDRWKSTDPAVDPGSDRADVSYRVSFHYEDGQLSTDGSPMADVSWDVDGDGVFERTGETIDWTPDEAGEQSVTLAYEDEGTTIAQTQRFRVSSGSVDEPPAVSGTVAVSNATPYNGQEVTFDASDAELVEGDQRRSVEQYHWNFGDGTTHTTTEPTITHAFADPGEYNVTTTLDAGNASASTTRTVSVELDDRPPEISDVAVDRSLASDEVTISANVTPVGPDVEAVRLGVGATFTSFTVTEPAADNATEGRVEATIDGDAVVADGEYTAVVEAVDELGNTTTERGDSVAFDTTPPGIRPRVDGLDTETATLTLDADEPFDLTDLRIAARGDGTADRTPNASRIPGGLEDAEDELAVDFEGGLVGGTNTTYTVALDATDDAGNEVTTEFESTVIPYELDNGTATLTPAGVNSTVTLDADAAAIDNDTDRTAVITATTVPPAGTELDAATIAGGFLDVDRVGLDANELENATVRIPLAAVDADLAEAFKTDELRTVRSADGERGYDPLATDYDADAKELVATADDFSQFAVAGTDETPPSIDEVGVDPGTEVAPDEGPVTVAFEYSPEISGIDVAETAVDVNASANRVETQITGERATVDIADLEIGETIAVDLTVADDAGNAETATETITVSESGSSGGGGSIGGGGGGGGLSLEPPHFTVEVQDAGGPYEPGETAEITAVVDNDGGTVGTQELTLATGGEVVDRESQQLAMGQQRFVTFTYDVPTSASGDQRVVIESANDSASTSLSIDAEASTGDDRQEGGNDTDDEAGGDENDTDDETDGDSLDDDDIGTDETDDAATGADDESDETGTDESTDDDGSPGFGPVIALAALLVGGIVRHRNRQD